MRQPIQVEAIIYRETDNEQESRQIGGRMLQFLALHRTSERGGFWQPMTGGVEDYDTDLMATVRREAGEELGFTDEQIVALRALDYQFSFPDDDGVTLTEHVFGVEVARDTDVVLSDEHDEHRWDSPEAIRELFRWPENREALDELVHSLEQPLVP